MRRSSWPWSAERPRQPLPGRKTVTRIGVSTLSLILLAMDIAGFIGTLFIGVFQRRGLYRTLIAIPIIRVLIVAMLVAFGRRTFERNNQDGVIGGRAKAALTRCCLSCFRMAGSR